jgi:hypothetical protein
MRRVTLLKPLVHGQDEALDFYTTRPLLTEPSTNARRSSHVQR